MRVGESSRAEPGSAVAFGLTAGAVPCRTECQLNESLKILLGEVAANRMIGGFWVLSGLAFVVFMNLRGRQGHRGRLPPKKKSRRRWRVVKSRNPLLPEDE